MFLFPSSVSSAPYLNDLFTIPCNLSGVPALTLPCALSPSTGLPIGLQLIGGYHQEAVMMDVAEWMESRVREDGVRLEPFQDDRLLAELARELGQ